MKIDPSNFTYELLSSLKFKELQKLSVQYRVNKRWAKKLELIENLLTIKDQSNSSPEEAKENDWKDGSVVFQTIRPPSNSRKDIDRRLTFNVNKPMGHSDYMSSHFTFDVPHGDKSLVAQDGQVPSSRDTYELPPKKFNSESYMDPRATYEVQQNGKILLENSIDPRATFEIPQNNRMLINDAEDIQKVNKEINRVKGKVEFQSASKKFTKSSLPKTSNIIFHTNEARKEENNKMGCGLPSQIKLTIPSSRVPKRYKKDTEDRKHNSPIKMSKKSINIKKSKLPTKLDITKSPRSIRAPINKQQNSLSLAKLLNTSVVGSNIPTIVASAEVAKPQIFPICHEKENVKAILCQKKSIKSDEMPIKKTNLPRINFTSPSISVSRHCLGLPPKRTPMKKENETKTPGKQLQAIPPNTISKPMTATKMPDFRKIHKRQFEQMDSLHDYIKKKEERARKLFGTPLQGNQQKSTTKNAAARLEFQLSDIHPGKKVGKSTENIKYAKAMQKEAVKKKLPTKLEPDVKSKNRSIINGVRTNKRFELQMKLRKL
ncbi:hypothetical protein RUM44_000596 [Polyplax serrata]|uniref:Uncharacterized protein n=1 Tax=Polyplax serrata TaxID=468196 RepID=A0ABR1B5W3_POLSC